MSKVVNIFFQLFCIELEVDPNLIFNGLDGDLPWINSRKDYRNFSISSYSENELRICLWFDTRKAGKNILTMYF